MERCYTCEGRGYIQIGVTPTALMCPVCHGSGMALPQIDTESTTGTLLKPRHVHFLNDLAKRMMELERKVARLESAQRRWPKRKRVGVRP
jgi:RecJ-like exonuclease